MATDKKISDLDPIPGSARPADEDLLITAREDSTNFKIPFSGFAQHSAERVNSAFTTGDQTINGVKTFSSFIMGNISGKLSGVARYAQDGVYTTGDQTIGGVKTFSNFIFSNVSGNLSGIARHVQDGVYTTGNQTIDGVKTFSDFISGNVSGNLSGTARYVEHGVYTTGDQTIAGEKTFSNFIKGNVSGNLSGTARYVQDGVYTTGDQTINGVKTFSSFISGNLSGTAIYAKYVQSGVYTSGDQNIYGTKDFKGELLLSGSPVLTEDNFGGSIKDVVYLTGNQFLSGDKTFYEYIKPSGGIVASNEEPIVITDGGNPNSYKFSKKSLSLAFESGVFITGGAAGGKSDLHVEGTVFADRINSLEDIVGESGAMVFTDGRDPALFEGPDKSLSMAFQSGVFITGGVGGEKANLHVEGTVFADRIDSLEDIIGESGAMVFTDGRDPALFEGPDKSLSMAFQSGVFITGEAGETADLFVQGSGIFYGGVRINGDLEVDSLNVASIVSHDYIYSHFTQDTNGNQDFFIPLHAGEGVINESNTPFASRGHTLVTPYKGRINKIMLRARGGSKNPGNTTFTVCTGHNPIIGGSSHVFNEEAVTIAGVDRASTYSFNFTNPLHFNQGSVILIKGKCAQSTSSLWTVTAEINYTID